MPINDTNEPRRHGFRTHIRVVREDGREFPNFFVAYRELLGTREELGYSEHQRMRAQVRAGLQPRDSHGFTWRAVGAGTAEAEIRWTDFTFGVELELLAPFHPGDEYAARVEMGRRLATIGAATWKVVRDGSLNDALGYEAMEVVSPVLQGVEGLAKLRAVMTQLEAWGCKVNRSCGFHVHVGVRGMQPARVRKIAVAFLNAEEHFDALVPPARRDGNRYCQSNNGVARNSVADLQRVNSISGIANVMNGGNSPAHYNSYRYYKLNFQSFVHHGTVEFRQHSGTVEADKACSWVRLVAGFCAEAAEKQEQVFGQRRTFVQFIDACAGEAATYLMGRARRFGVAQLDRPQQVAAA